MSGAELRIGMLLPTRQGAGLEAAPLASALELAERAEALGLDSVWAGESVLARPRHDPYTVLAAVAARTKRIGLGTSVALPALHAPLLFAYRLAALNELARGRLVIGAGIGIDNEAMRAEFAGAGAPFEQRVGRMLASVRAVRERLESSLPFWIGATLAREAALERAGRECAEWLAGYARAGVGHFVLRSPDIAGQLDAIARELGPRLRALFERSRT